MISIQVHDLKEADGEPPKRTYSFYDYSDQTTLVPPSQATPENIAKAKLIVSWLQASGGQSSTNSVETHAFVSVYSGTLEQFLYLVVWGHLHNYTSSTA